MFQEEPRFFEGLKVEKQDRRAVNIVILVIKSEKILDADLYGIADIDDITELDSPRRTACSITRSTVAPEPLIKSIEPGFNSGMIPANFPL